LDDVDEAGVEASDVAGADVAAPLAGACVAAGALVGAGVGAPQAVSTNAKTILAIKSLDFNIFFSPVICFLANKETG
jgi:hypothetical protein